MPSVIAFDEAHAETWSVDLARAIQLKPLRPEYHFYGHVSDLVKDATGAYITRLTDPWTDETLKLIQTLVIAHPAEKKMEANWGGSPIFSSEDLQRVVRFVEEGGGLFVLGEWNTSRWGSNINDLIKPFGVVLGDDTLASSKSPANAHLLSRHFVCTSVDDEHSITDGVHGITYHRGCSVSAIQGHTAKELIKAPDGKPVFVAAEYGKGRVAVIGDTDVFSLPFIGHLDNARLLVRTFQWLTKSQTETKSHTTIRSKAYPLIDTKHLVDVSTENGEHWIDCSKEFPGSSSFQQEQQLVSPYDSLEDFLEHATLTFHELPRELRQKIIKFKSQSNKHGVLLLRGLPVDSNLPNTPADSKRSKQKVTWVSEFWLAVIAQGLGDAISYSQEKDGEVFQNLCPTKKNEKELSSESSTITLDFHTEVAFHPFMPDFLLLYCLRPDHNREAQTFFASTRHIIQQVPLRYRAILFEDAFRTGIDFSFGSPSGLQANGPVLPVLSGSPYDPTMKFDLDLMKGVSQAGECALQEMKKAVNNAKDYVKLDAGDLLIIDNKKATHGRSYFTPKYDGFDRWLQRVFVVRDITASEEDRRRGERIIQTEFIV